MALYTSGGLDYVCPTSMSEQGLDQVFKRCRRDPQYDAVPDEALRASLRWSSCDSPLHLVGEEHFDVFQPVMEELAEAMQTIDTDESWDEFEAFWDGAIDAICTVLAGLDREGLFGAPPERERLFLTIMMGEVAQRDHPWEDARHTEERPLGCCPFPTVV